MALDQDMLNVALMTMNVPISPMSGSGMDISRSGYVMSHPLSGAKPWRRRYIRDALRGYPPDTANKAFWTKVAEPIEVLSPARRRRALLSLAIAGAVGRFYRRT